MNNSFTRIQFDRDNLLTELKDGFTLYKYPLDNYSDNIMFKVEFAASKTFSISRMDISHMQHENHLQMIVQRCEHDIARVVRDKVFGFESNNALMIFNKKVKVSDSCPQGEFIIHPRDYHELLERYDPRHMDVIS